MNKSRSSLKKEDVLHLAKLANIPVSEKEVDKYGKQLDETLKYVENLNELSTDNVSPTNHTVNLTNVNFEDGKECTRQLTQEESLKNSKNPTSSTTSSGLRGARNNYFVVKRIIG